MELLTALYDRDVGGECDCGVSVKPPRFAARAVLLDRDGRAALICSGKHDFYTLPGGGIEPGETPERACLRELREETGCESEIIRELGFVDENRAQADYTQRSYYFLACVIGEPGELSLTQAELDEDTRLIWLPFDRAAELLRTQPADTYRMRFVRARDTAAVQKALEFLNNIV